MSLRLRTRILVILSLGFKPQFDHLLTLGLWTSYQVFIFKIYQRVQCAFSGVEK